MNINVPQSVLDHFWEEPLEGSMEFWAFRFKPPVSVGDPLIFKLNNKPIARAICAAIEPPGKSQCDHSGNYLNRWKVFWHNESFVDLRERSLLT